MFPSPSYEGDALRAAAAAARTLLTPEDDGAGASLEEETNPLAGMEYTLLFHNIFTTETFAGVALGGHGALKARKRPLGDPADEHHAKRTRFEEMA